jgi:hypothetical protein
VRYELEVLTTILLRNVIFGLWCFGIIWNLQGLVQFYFFIFYYNRVECARFIMTGSEDSRRVRIRGYVGGKLQLVLMLHIKEV